MNTGIYVFEPGVLDYIPADSFYDFGKQVFPALLAADNAKFYGMKLGRRVLARHRHAAGISPRD